MTNAQVVAERAEEVRDLRTQIAGLQVDDAREIIFKDVSPRRGKVLIYSMVDGEPITIRQNMLDQVLAKRLANGQFMFTTRKEQAPVYVRGNVKCFLHPQSEERPILAQLGISQVCDAEHLGNDYSKEIHAEHRHKSEWKMYQRYISDNEQKRWRETQEMQAEAMLAVANRAAGEPSEAADRMAKARAAKAAKRESV